VKAADWDDRYRASELVWSSTPNQFVVEYLSDVPAGAMLDLAGGEGRNALWFAERGWQAEVADFSSVAVERFLARAEQAGVAERCAGTVADATRLTDYAYEPFDLVVMAYLQIPASELAVAIAEAARVLGEAGLFFGVWHARENLDGGFGGPQDPRVLPTQEELRIAVDRAGLSLKTLELRERFVETDAGTRTALDVVLLAD
jgi:ubiquinone/menaquinone biosynthesis C-methylase UbiE